MSSIQEYRFFLNFINSFGEIEITEPVGFDGISFIIEQGAKDYGRNAFRMNEAIDLEFYKGEFGQSDVIQTRPNGTVSMYLSMGFEYLLAQDKLTGYESEVEFIIRKGETNFVTGILDYKLRKTDGLTFFKTSIINNGEETQLQRRHERTTDIFSKEDLDGNTIAPAIAENILLKAKPITQQSEFNLQSTQSFFHPFVSAGSGTVYYNAQLNITKGNIENTINYLPFYTTNTNDLGNVGFIDAQNTLSEVTLTVNLIGQLRKLTGTLNTQSQLVLRYRVITDIADPIGSTIANENIAPSNGWVITNANPILDIDHQITANLFIPSGARLIIYFQQNTGFSGGGNVQFDINTFEIDIKATATAIDTVIKGVRYIDVIKANILRCNGFNVSAKDYEQGGRFYDQFAFTGNLIKQRDDVPFPVKFKELMENLKELNDCYQILPDKLYIGSYKDFYPNKEIAAVLSSPDQSFLDSYNERYTLGGFEYKYKTFEQDRDEENTTDAIHTESEWLLSNKLVEDTKEVQVDYIRDAFNIEKARKDGSKETTSTDDDDKLFIVDVVPLAPNSRGGFSALLAHQAVVGGDLRLAKEENMPSWNVIGIGINSVFEITEGENIGTYTVTEIEDSILTLSPQTGTTVTFSGEAFTVVEYSYVGVLYTNRTNEGLESFENILNADNYSNLKYSIKRNMEYWKPYLATASLYRPNGELKNTYFKSNGNAITKFIDEPLPIQENANIPNTELTNPVLTPYLYETTLVVSFDTAVSIINAVDTINDDDTIGGFIRCIDTNNKVIKLYPKEFDYEPASNTMTLLGEERYESDTLTIDTTGSNIVINEVGYDIDELSDPFYEFDGDYFKIYDKNGLPVINPTHFSKIELNGVSYNSSSDLLGALIS